MQTDWNAEARKTANYIYENMHEAHRGAMPWHNGIIIAFGSDGYTDDPRSQHEVEYLRRRLKDTDEAPLELGFGVDEGYTWAMLLRHDSKYYKIGKTAKWVHAVVWTGWTLACPAPVCDDVPPLDFGIGDGVKIVGVQGLIARTTIHRERLQLPSV